MLLEYQVLDKVKEEQFQRPATRGGRGGGPGGDRGGDRGRGRGMEKLLC